MENNITLNEWLKKFNNNEFNDGSVEVQISAGWYDWFCSNSSLVNKTKKLGKIVNKISKLLSEDFKNTHYVWFKNNCPCYGDLYDDIRFSDLKTGNNDLVFIPKSGFDNSKNETQIASFNNKLFHLQDKNGFVFRGDYKKSLEFIKNLNL